ncbi:hypothetical protein ACFCZ4_06740 [Streptomyces microflavus]|uniref:hypothetical protein n=1 Tax=Streptomyces microflavus TaxID=1919 RepID=UPI0035E321B1
MLKILSALTRHKRKPAGLPDVAALRQALDSYCGSRDQRDVFEEYAADLLTDLLLLARAEGVDPEALMERAFTYYVTEPANA